MLANIGLKMVLEMLFLTFSKADIRFKERELVWRTYTAVEALPTIKRVEIIDKREFALAALNANDETFVVHAATLAEPSIMPIYPFCQTQVAALTSEETKFPLNILTFLTSFY